MKLTTGVNFTKILGVAYAQVDPKIVKSTVKLLVSFTQLLRVLIPKV